MNVVDLFSGMCGFGLGFEAAGFTLAGYSEIDDFCLRVAAHHFPNARSLGDVRTIESVDCDVLTAGVPCQPASVAGKRKGDSDERWLWDDYIRIISASRPRWTVAENVRGFATLRGRGLDWLIGTMERIGYEVWPFVISAQDIGAPHKRERLWIVSHGIGERCKCGRKTESFAPSDGALPAASKHLANSDGARREREVGERLYSEGARKEQARKHVRSMLPDWPLGPGQVTQIPLQADGLSRRLAGRRDAVKATGNAVVPQIPYLIAKAILRHEGLNEWR